MEVIDGKEYIRGKHGCLVDINEPSYRRCKGWSKQEKRRCTKSASPTYDVCYMHGGKTPRGPKSATFKKGHVSKFALPAELQKRLDDMIAHEDMLNLTENLGLLYVRLQDKLKGLSTGESARIWRELREAFDELMEYNAVGDTKGVTAQINRIGIIIAQGDDVESVWAEADPILEPIRKHTETDAKIKRDQDQYVTVEQVMVTLNLMNFIFARKLEEHQGRILDESTRQSIIAETESAYRAISTRQPGRPALPKLVVEPRRKRAAE